MNPAITAALAAAQQSAAFDPIAQLTKEGALTTDKAIALDAKGPTEQALIDNAIEGGLIHRRSDGRLFVNQRAVEERNARAGSQILISLLVGLSIAASVIALVALR